MTEQFRIQYEKCYEDDEYYYGWKNYIKLIFMWDFPIVVGIAYKIMDITWDSKLAFQVRVNMVDVDIVTLNILAENKAIAYEKTNEFMERFKSENGSYICKEILGCDISTDEGRAYAQENNSFKEICPGMVKSAVNILESIIWFSA